MNYLKKSLLLSLLIAPTALASTHARYDEIYAQRLTDHLANDTSYEGQKTRNAVKQAVEDYYDYYDPGAAGETAGSFDTGEESYVRNAVCKAFARVAANTVRARGKADRLNAAQINTLAAEVNNEIEQMKINRQINSKGMHPDTKGAFRNYVGNQLENWYKAKKRSFVDHSRIHRLKSRLVSKKRAFDEAKVELAAARTEQQIAEQLVVEATQLYSKRLKEYNNAKIELERVHGY